MEEKFRFFAYDVIEDGDGMFQVNNRMLQKGYIILNVDYDGIVLDDDYDIIGAIHDNWVESDTELGIWNDGGTGRVIELEEANTGCPIGQLVPESEICQPL